MIEMNQHGRMFLVIALLACAFLFCQQQSTIPVNNTLQYAVEKYLQTARELSPENGIPRTTDENGKWICNSPRDWTSGFYPGVLWYLYEFSGDNSLKTLAESWTAQIEEQKNANDSHDVGFQIFCSFGNGYRLTQNEAYHQVILKAAETLATRFDDKIGATRSWSWQPNPPKWTFPVIIDNMMNLELLYWAGKNGGQPALYDLALRHAMTTAANHIREDNTTFHVADFNPETGEFIRGLTWQGYSDSSCWARGQAWGIYGFTMSFRETRDERCLAAAQRLADYFITHLPADAVPYWDFNAPNIPNEVRDASAAAIAASGLLELSRLVTDQTEKQHYFQTAERILQTLCSPDYLTKGKQSDSLLLHCVGSKPGGSEIDDRLIYAEYYFVEALLRYRSMKQQV